MSFLLAFFKRFQTTERLYSSDEVEELVVAIRKFNPILLDNRLDTYIDKCYAIWRNKHL